MDPRINSDPFSDPNSHPPAGPISGSEKTPLPMGGVFGPDRSPSFREEFSDERSFSSLRLSGVSCIRVDRGVSGSDLHAGEIRTVRSPRRRGELLAPVECAVRSVPDRVPVPDSAEDPVAKPSVRSVRQTRQQSLSRQHLIDCLSRVVFAHLPHDTAKQAQAAWRTADRIAVDVVGELERIALTQPSSPNGAEA